MRVGMCLLVCLIAAGVAHGGTAFFVAPGGNDAWSGTLKETSAAGDDGPFATLGRARGAMRAADGGTVYLRGGDYHLSEDFVLDAEDSGTEARPNIWRSYPGETVRLIGGVRVDGFVPHEGAIVKRNLSDMPLSPAGFRQLFFNGQRQTLARWPNAGAGDLPGGEWTFVSAAAPEETKQRFLYGGDRPKGWEDPRDLEVSIWPNYNWWQTIVDVSEMDAPTGKIVLAEALPYTIEPGRRFFFQNVFEEVDAPGEWYFNDRDHTLYFWPPEAIAEADVVIPIAENVIRIEQAAHINVMGLTLEASRGDAVRVKDATACLIAKNVVRNSYGYGISITGGKDVRAMGNDVYHTGRGGISMSGGDRATLTPGNHQAINNHIHHFGNLYQTYQTGVNVQGVANRIANNLIHDAPHIGILLGGNDHVIEYNELHHVCMQGSDNGGFYMGRDWTQRGNILRYNKFHDIYGFGLAGLRAGEDGSYRYETPHQAWGIYLDDCSSGTTIFGNAFYRVPLCGVMIGGGRDNVVENNIFVDCVPALHIDDRWDSYTWETMFERLDAMNYKEPPYSERYPELLEMGDDPRRPEGNRFERNIVSYQYDHFRGLSSTAENKESAVLYDFDQFDPKSTTINENLIDHQGYPIRVLYSVYQDPTPAKILSWQEWKELGFDIDSKTGSPSFVNPEEDDYRLFQDSTALEMGFKPIPFDRIGLIADEFRASWPVEKDTRRDGVTHQEWKVEAPALNSDG